MNLSLTNNVCSRRDSYVLLENVEENMKKKMVQAVGGPMDGLALNCNGKHLDKAEIPSLLNGRWVVHVYIKQLDGNYYYSSQEHKWE